MAPKQRTPSKKSKYAEQKDDLMDVTPPACAKKLKVSTGTQIRIASKDSEDQMNKFYDAMECAGGSEGEEDDLNFSRNYFIAKETRGLGKKSGKKISDIDVVDEQELRAALSSLEPKHEKEQFALLDSYKVLYSKWLFQLRCGFGLLLYGFGSKRKLLEDFALSTLTDGGVVVINGYLPSVNLKNVISTIAEVLWSQLKSMKKSSTRSKANAVPPLNLQSLDEILEFFNGSIESVKDAVVYVIVHNIDGPALRESDAQQCLAAIAACSRVRVVASIDHVNAPILWDKQMARAQFNWWWYHAPTYAAYTVEGTFLPLILASTGAVQNARTATIVLQSLTPNAQSVFKILAEYQLAHTDEQGLPIQRLYTLCREKFLVSSQVTLNSHLTEFKDHELVRTRRGTDGQDCLYIPFPSEALSKILQDMNV